MRSYDTGSRNHTRQYSCIRIDDPNTIIFKSYIQYVCIYIYIYIYIDILAKVLSNQKFLAKSCVYKRSRGVQTGFLHIIVMWLALWWSFELRGHIFNICQEMQKHILRYPQDSLRETQMDGLKYILMKTDNPEIIPGSMLS